MKKERQNRILNIMLIYIFLQPFFDILSNLYIDGIIDIGISTIIKPLFVFILATYMFFKYCKQRKKWLIYILMLFILVIGHTYLLNSLLIEKTIILHEIRFFINVVYMIALFFIFYTIYYFYEDKKELLKKLKKVTAFTFVLYCLLLILAVLTNTSGLTYEYSDKNKLGFKGWYDSGQILGHAISTLFPIMYYTLLKPSNKWYLKLLILPIIVTVMILGTKVPYFIIIITLFLYLVLSIFNFFIDKKYKVNLLNYLYTLVLLLIMLLSYKYLPVYHNIKINEENYNIEISNYKMYLINGKFNIDKMNELIQNSNGKKVGELINYMEWSKKSTLYLEELYKSEIVHPSNMRLRQFFYSAKKYSLSSFKYKIFGIGYLIQEDSLSLESDFFMSFFCFGILGFICMLYIPIKEFANSLKNMLFNIKNNDIETYLLFMSLGIFFSISIFAGYTFIYTNYSIFLVLLVFMLKTKISINNSYLIKNKKIRNVSFLMLHLGYGGIETATINTANALSKDYNVELVSLYKLDKNQENLINEKVSIRYLSNLKPNKNELIDAIKTKKIIKIIKESSRAIYILFKKYSLIKKEIRKNKSDALISTRMEFSKLLSKYGTNTYIKIAQEHQHHNNNKKYINTIKYSYNNIDYLFALTRVLEKDYKNFLENNNFHTNVKYVPNMLKNNFNKKSKLNSNIISIGRLHPGKKVDELIDIFSCLNSKKDKLYIIGDGEQFNLLKKKVEQLNLKEKVYLEGYKSHDEQEKYLLDSCVFTMTSESEGLPMVLLEAMSYGIPCIAFETESGVKDIIKNNKNGFVIKNRNKEEYINKLNLILREKTIRKRLGENAYKTALLFSEEKVIEKWKKILRNK